MRVEVLAGEAGAGAALHKLSRTGPHALRQPGGHLLTHVHVDRHECCISTLSLLMGTRSHQQPAVLEALLEAIVLDAIIRAAVGMWGSQL